MKPLKMGDNETLFMIERLLNLFTPSITGISNIADRSFSLSPELLYTGITNLELRLKAGFIAGENLSEYGERPNDYRVELRARYYF